MTNHVELQLSDEMPECLKVVFIDFTSELGSD